MKLITERYLSQWERWPATGRHILASFDGETVVVYQAYSPAIGEFAIRHGYFGGDFSYRRMSWIKPNFLWMMYRSNWGRSAGQEVVLGVRVRRSFFEAILAAAVPSSFDISMYPTHDEWKAAVEHSQVRLQWDPDHRPDGAKEERRAIQLGLRGEVLAAYGKQEIVEIIDMREFVAEQRDHANGIFENLATPHECVYRPAMAIAGRLGLD